MSEPESEPARPRAPLLIAAVLLAALFAFAFIAAPSACSWGQSAYSVAGLAVCAVMVILPWAARARVVTSRLGSAAILGGSGCLVWIAGFAAADIQLLCRLF